MATILGRCVCFLMGVCMLALQSMPQESAPHKTYFVYVVCEGADKIAVVKYGPKGAMLDHTLRTGRMPGADISGPHGIVVSPDREFYFVTLAHGRPFGQALKYRTKDDAVVGR